jgi:hypothetical protein
VQLAVASQVKSKPAPPSPGVTQHTFVDVSQVPVPHVMPTPEPPSPPSPPLLDDDPPSPPSGWPPSGWPPSGWPPSALPLELPLELPLLLDAPLLEVLPPLELPLLLPLALLSSPPSPPWLLPLLELPHATAAVPTASSTQNRPLFIASLLRPKPGTSTLYPAGTAG